MAKEVTTQTYSTVQRKELIGLGVSLADIRASEAEGTTFEDAIELAHAAKTANDDDLQADADRTAKATKRALRPENETHPGISVYNPTGGPWPVMPYEGIWVVEPVHQDYQCTVEEIELFTQLEPGEYRCQRSDGAVLPVSVTVERGGPENRVTKKKVWFNTRDQLRHNLPPKTVMMREMIRQHAESKALVTA